MSSIVTHTLNPIYNENSKVLILGTIPSPKSREVGFYYSHPQNKFWRVMSDIFLRKLPTTNEEKENFLYDNNIALWDVLKSCEINGAADNTIKNPIANDLTVILKTANIKAVFTTGTKATAYYKKYCLKVTNIQSIFLPSTSPANCKHYTYDDIKEKYREILHYVDVEKP